MDEMMIKKHSQRSFDENKSGYFPAKVIRCV